MEYKCTVCNESFKRHEHLIRHARRHTNEKPFQCTICDKHFARRDILSRHAIVHIPLSARTQKASLQSSRKRVTAAGLDAGPERADAKGEIVGGPARGGPGRGPGIGPGPETGSGLGTGRGAKKRVNQACVGCARGKCRCDGAQPCSTCQTRNLQCLYITGPQRTGTQHTQQTSSHTVSSPRVQIQEVDGDQGGEMMEIRGKRKRTESSASTTAAANVLLQVASAHASPNGNWILDYPQIPEDRPSILGGSTFGGGGGGGGASHLGTFEFGEPMFPSLPTSRNDSRFPSRAVSPLHDYDTPFEDLPRVSPFSHLSVLSRHHLDERVDSQIKEGAQAVVKGHTNTEITASTDTTRPNSGLNSPGMYLPSLPPDYLQLPLLPIPVPPAPHTSVPTLRHPRSQKQKQTQTHIRSLHHPTFSPSPSGSSDTESNDLDSPSETSAGGFGTLTEIHRQRLCEYARHELPKAAILDNWAHDYFQYFHPSIPVLHAPTFDPDETPYILVLAVLCVGSIYSSSFYSSPSLSSVAGIAATGIGPPAGGGGSGGIEGETDIRFLVRKAISLEPDVFLALQAGFLMNVLDLFHGNPTQMNSSYISHTSLLAISRSRLLFTENYDSAPVELDLEARWQILRRGEERRRLGWCLLLFDMSLSLYFGFRQGITDDEVLISLPCLEGLWEAPSAEIWRSEFESGEPVEEGPGRRGGAGGGSTRIPLRARTLRTLGDLESGECPDLGVFAKAVLGMIYWSRYHSIHLLSLAHPPRPPHPPHSQTLHSPRQTKSAARTRTGTGTLGESLDQAQQTQFNSSILATETLLRDLHLTLTPGSHPDSLEFVNGGIAGWKRAVEEASVVCHIARLGMCLEFGDLRRFMTSYEDDRNEPYGLRYDGDEDNDDHDNDDDNDYDNDDDNDDNNDNDDDDDNNDDDDAEKSESDQDGKDINLRHTKPRKRDSKIKREAGPVYGSGPRRKRESEWAEAVDGIDGEKARRAASNAAKAISLLATLNPLSPTIKADKITAIDTSPYATSSAPLSKSLPLPFTSNTTTGTCQPSKSIPTAPSTMSKTAVAAATPKSPFIGLWTLYATLTLHNFSNHHPSQLHLETMRLDLPVNSSPDPSPNPNPNIHAHATGTGTISTLNVKEERWVKKGDLIPQVGVGGIGMLVRENVARVFDLGIGILGGGGSLGTCAASTARSPGRAGIGIGAGTGMGMGMGMGTGTGTGTGTRVDSGRRERGGGDADGDGDGDGDSEMVRSKRGWKMNILALRKLEDLRDREVRRTRYEN